MKEDWIYRRGDLYLVDLGAPIGSKQGGVRPVVVLQNDTGNFYAPTITVAPLTSKINKKKRLPTHYLLRKAKGLERPSTVLAEQSSAIWARSAAARCVGSMKRFGSSLAITFPNRSWEAGTGAERAVKPMDKLITRKEAAARLRISVTTLDAARTEGLITYIQYVENGCVYFTDSAIQEYMARCTHRAKTKEPMQTYRTPRAARR